MNQTETGRQPRQPMYREDRLVRLAAVPLLLVAIVLRFTGLNWDLAQWIHPDEGHMRLITGAVQWPTDLTTYFDTATSPLNPRNHDQVYSYGTLPLFATRAAAEWLDRGCGDEPSPAARAIAGLLLTRIGHPVPPSPADWLCYQGTFTWTYSALIGRHMAALADIGTILLVGALALALYDGRTALLAIALATTAAFMIQQAHFYTVDSAATFFTALTALCAVRAGRARQRRGLWAWVGAGGISTGLAAACKVSAALAAGLVALGALWWLRRSWTGPAVASRAPTVGEDGRSGRLSGLLHAGGALLVAALLSIAAFRVGQPYAFEGPGFFGLQPNTEWFDRLTQISEEQSGIIDYPSGRQWTSRLPVIFPLRNLGLWGLGLPLGLTAAAGWAITGWELARGDHRRLVLWVWSTAYVAFYATRWVKAMRYFLPVYPFLILMAAYLLGRLLTTRAPWRRLGWFGPAWAVAVLVGTTLWGVGLFGIYVRPHTRIAASRWIYDNVPDGSVVANEHWDWGLPLRLDGHDAFRAGSPGPTFTQVTLELYNEDTPEKREQLLGWLDQVDYIFLASNRLYGSIARLPERYPLTNAYYRDLFSGELGFEPVAKFTSYIKIGPFVFPDQEIPFPLASPSYATQDELLSVPFPPAEESFSVYDHPDCLILRKSDSYSHDAAAARLNAVDLTAVAIGQSPQQATAAAVRTAHNVLFYLGLGLVAVVSISGIVHVHRKD